MSVFAKVIPVIANPSRNERKAATWLDYWYNAKMVAIDEIQSIHDMNTARKYCSCMRVGVFSPDLVTDLEMWRGLLLLRQAQK